MPNEIVSVFNNIFGSNITFVANAYPRDIWVLFASTIYSYDVSVSVQTTTPTIVIKRTATGANIESIRVKSRGYNRKERSQSTEYLSIYTTDANGAKRIVCENKQILANKSFIITQDGYIVDQKYGANIWIDRDGHKH